MENKISEEDFRKRFDAATAKAMQDAGIGDLLVHLKFSTDEPTFNRIKTEIGKDIESIRNASWYKALSGAAIDQVTELREMAKKYETFIKSPEESAEIGARGGEAKGKKTYQAFLSLVERKNIRISDYTSNEKLKIALQDLGKDEGYKIDAKTAGKYKVRYLKDNPGK